MLLLLFVFRAILCMRMRMRNYSVLRLILTFLPISYNISKMLPIIQKIIQA